MQNKNFARDPNTRLPERVFYRQKEVMALLGVSRSTLLRMIDEGKFPKPIKISARVNYWKVELVHKWFDEKI